ncbi:TPA: NUDIX domain-containing protein [Pseudomonas aeruginosa]|jgi:8-oxo-dGTP pyrophosphatase MutT (NUDIX family)|uniref:NUDIX hydrolase n=1 Tax=Stutzerimonas zhaodongensis TaxID=1176257 RepID=UPI001F4E50B0|nr:NUDIX domain-containing protein [Stutzerimonas zhaodongensis]MDT3709910.1 NUDIX domain-containing protein [Pseudomonadaceae bacterium]MDT3709934.1 NUDIX domain-containing protein [Pseudomonadaceae bacterium]UNG16605.1 NUDIX domain-containing protein [Stutzerimonas zhaodongensis]HCK0509295.1 NUDIX domain-containing protein [Pseudomonas aeruginosa]
MRERKAARLLVISPSKEVLLFRFHHTDGALAGETHWATPGGGLEEGETFHAAAVRELYEETGIEVSTVAEPVADRRVTLILPSGEAVVAVEKYFIVHAKDNILSRSQWTAHEEKVMVDQHWWSAEELTATTETVWPENLMLLLVNAGVFSLPPDSV